MAPEVKKIKKTVQLSKIEPNGDNYKTEAEENFSKIHEESQDHKLVQKNENELEIKLSEKELNDGYKSE